MRRHLHCAAAAFLGLLLVLAPGLLHAQPEPPDEGLRLPQSVLDLMKRDPDAFQFKRALRGMTARAEANRRLLAEGHLKAPADEIEALTAVSGTVRIPVLLGRFSDTPIDFVDPQDLQDMLFDGPWPTGTMADYWNEVSYGLLSVTGTVRDWVNTSLSRAEVVDSSDGMDYDSDAKTGDWIHEVIEANDGAVDFGQFDNDGPDGIPNSGDDDGYVDFIAILQPNESASSGGDGIWAHHGVLSAWDAGIYTTNDAAHDGGNIRIDDYVVLPGLDASGGSMVKIGVFCHEFGHSFGLPDLYDLDPDDGDSAGIGHWGLMASGHKLDPARPVHLCAWSKVQLGWISPGFVVYDLLHWPLPSSTFTPAAFYMWKDGTAGGREYFLVEYRNQDGFNGALPSPGILIWHIDDRQASAGNRDETRKWVDLECADQTGADGTPNADDLDAATNKSDAGDPFCEGDSFTPLTTPSSDAVNGTPTGVMITNILRCGSSTALANLIVGSPQPLQNLCMRDCGSDTCFEPSPCDIWWASPEVYIDNNEDGIIDPPAPGLINKLFANVRNVGSGGSANITVDFYQAESGAGLLWPGTATPIGSDQVSVIGAYDSQKAMVEWDLPYPPPNEDHWCIGAIATNSVDGQSSEEALWDNNVTQINIAELYAKAGEQAPVAATEEEHALQHAGGKRAEPFNIVRTVQLCNPLWSPSCNAEVYLGSPPNFDDVVLPPGWDAGFDSDVGPIGYGECVSLDVYISCSDAHHLDQAIIPITLFCGGELMGGVILKINIDNFPPFVSCDPFRVEKKRFAGDDYPMTGAIRVQWEEDMVDVKGYPDRVERWKLYRGTTPDFLLGPGTLLLETCLDENTQQSGYQHYLDPPTDGAQYYKLQAIDRAGNSTVTCAKAVVVDATDAPPVETGRLALAQNTPNPFNPSTRIRFTLPRDGEARLEIFSARGERVRELLQDYQSAGDHVLVWDGRDDKGQRVASGAYIYRLTFDGMAETKRMLLVK